MNGASRVLVARIRAYWGGMAVIDSVGSSLIPIRFGFCVWASLAGAESGNANCVKLVHIRSKMVGHFYDCIRSKSTHSMFTLTSTKQKSLCTITMNNLLYIHEVSPLYFTISEVFSNYLHFSTHVPITSHYKTGKMEIKLGSSPPKKYCCLFISFDCKISARASLHNRDRNIFFSSVKFNETHTNTILPTYKIIRSSVRLQPSINKDGNRKTHSASFILIAMSKPIDNTLYLRKPARSVKTASPTGGTFNFELRNRSNSTGNLAMIKNQREKSKVNLTDPAAASKSSVSTDPLAPLVPPADPLAPPTDPLAPLDPTTVDKIGRINVLTGEEIEPTDPGTVKETRGDQEDDVSNGHTSNTVVNNGAPRDDQGQSITQEEMEVDETTSDMKISLVHVNHPAATLDEATKINLFAQIDDYLDEQPQNCQIKSTKMHQDGITIECKEDTCQILRQFISSTDWHQIVRIDRDEQSNVKTTVKIINRGKLSKQKVFTKFKRSNESIGLDVSSWAIRGNRPLPPHDLLLTITMNETSAKKIFQKKDNPGYLEYGLNGLVLFKIIENGNNQEKKDSVGY